MPQQSQAGAGRIALFDNIKGLLIVLVVVGHVAHPVHNDNPAISCLFDVIYLFHMPLFVFVSGLFAKRAGGGQIQTASSRSSFSPRSISSRSC